MYSIPLHHPLSHMQIIWTPSFSTTSRGSLHFTAISIPVYLGEHIPGTSKGKWEIACVPFFMFKVRSWGIRNRYNISAFSLLVKSCLIWLISVEQEFNTRSFKWDHSYINEIQTDPSLKKMIKKTQMSPCCYSNEWKERGGIFEAFSPSLPCPPPLFPPSLIDLDLVHLE